MLLPDSAVAPFYERLTPGFLAAYQTVSILPEIEHIAIEAFEADRQINIDDGSSPWLIFTTRPGERFSLRQPGVVDDALQMIRDDIACDLNAEATIRWSALEVMAQRGWSNQLSFLRVTSRLSRHRGQTHKINVVGVREHPIESYRGLLAVPGVGPYPITDSTYIRSFGVGVRQRGAAVAIQIGTGTTYTAPTIQL